MAIPLCGRLEGRFVRFPSSNALATKADHGYEEGETVKDVERRWRMI